MTFNELGRAAAGRGGGIASALDCLSTCFTGALTSCVALSTLEGVAEVGPAVVDAGRPLKCTGGFRV